MQTSFSSMGGNSGGHSAGGAMPKGNPQDSAGEGSTNFALQKGRLMEELKKLVNEGKKCSNEHDEIVKEIAFIRARIAEAKISLRDVMNTFSRLAIAYNVVVNEHDPQAAIAEVRKNGAPEEDVLKMEKELKNYGEEQERLASLQEKLSTLEKLKEQNKKKNEKLNSEFKKKFDELEELQKQEDDMEKQDTGNKQNARKIMPYKLQNDDGGMSMHMKGPGAGAFGGNSGGDGN